MVTISLLKFYYTYLICNICWFTYPSSLQKWKVYYNDILTGDLKQISASNGILWRVILHFHYLPLLRNLSSHDGLDGKGSWDALWEIPQALDPTVTRTFATTPKNLTINTQPQAMHLQNQKSSRELTHSLLLTCYLESDRFFC